MSAFAPVLVGLGGALGATARHLVGRRVGSDAFPAATLTVNALGSLLLGYLTFAGVGGPAMLLLGTGACGAFTTFSSFSVDTLELWQAGERVRAGAYAVGTLVVCLFAVWVGAALPPP